MTFPDDSNLDGGFSTTDPANSDADTPASPLEARREHLTAALLDGETGVQFESLVLFAEPLFSQYGLDIAEAFEMRTDTKAVSDEALALLETARMLWAFFSLPPAERAPRRPALTEQLIGASPTEEERLDLATLLNTAEVHWQALLPTEIEAAQKTGHRTLDFDALREHPAFRMGEPGEPASAVGFGPTGLSEAEARALFAQPLLEDPDVLTDPDAFETALSRAEAYWTLICSLNGNVDEDIRRFARREAASKEEQKAVEREAHDMLNRFRELFPEAAADLSA